MEKKYWEVFMKNNCFWVYYKCIINQKNLDHATRFDKSDLATKSNFIALKAEVGKLDINELVNVPTSLNNLKTKIDNLHVGKLKKIKLM